MNSTDTRDIDAQRAATSPADNAADVARASVLRAFGWSLARDIEILLATLPAVVSGRGAY